MSDDPYKLLAEHENGKEKLYRRATDDLLFRVTEYPSGRRTTQRVGESVLDHARHLVQWHFIDAVKS